MKERLDLRLLRENRFPTRERARKSIQNGLVTVNGAVVTKPGTTVSSDAEITVTAELHSFVGRGGVKLSHAFSEWNLNVTQAVCMDVGASTGGFTDCMLKHGAARVYAVDVGSGQLDPSLCGDLRVRNFEKTNVRYLEPKQFGELMDFAAMDVSFISVTKLFAGVTAQLKDGAGLVTLIKPQFEAGPENLGKNGIVVRKASVHENVIRAVIQSAGTFGLSLCGLTVSPITGGSGNIEYLAYFKKQDGEAKGLPDGLAERTVHEAFLYHSKSGKGIESGVHTEDSGLPD